MSYYSGYEKYKSQKVLTAGPGELILMMYDGAIKQIKLAEIYIREGNFEQTNNSLIKAQNIVNELLRSLNLEYSLANQLLSIYEFILNELVIINVKKQEDKIRPVLEILEELRDTWAQTIQITRASTYASG